MWINIKAANLQPVTARIDPQKVAPSPAVDEDFSGDY